MSTVQCCVCNSNICLTDVQHYELEQSHGIFYCPAGHQQHFPGESDRDKVRRLERDRDFWKARADQRMEWYRNLRDRIGMCPWPECEWRSLAGPERVLSYVFRHLRTKHGVLIEIPKRLRVVA